MSIVICLLMVNLFLPSSWNFLIGGAREQEAWLIPSQRRRSSSIENVEYYHIECMSFKILVGFHDENGAW